MGFLAKLFMKKKSHSLRKRLFKSLLCLILAVSLCGITPIQSQSAEGDIPIITTMPGFTTTIDEYNNICIETFDLVKTSSIWYRSLGFSISRCALGEERLINGAESEWVDMLLYEQIMTSTFVMYNGKLYEHCIFRIPLNDLLAQIRRAGADDPAYLEWATEIENYYYHKVGPVCYLKFDGIMTTVNENISTGNEGKIITDSYHFDSKGKVYFNRPKDNGANPRDIQNAYGWRNKQGLESHFNKYLPFGSTSSVPSTPTITQAPVSLYETKNYSSIFDISTAIPSGEDVTNVVSASAFTGNDLDVATMEVTQSNYTATYNYMIKETTTTEATSTFLKTIDMRGTTAPPPELQLELSNYMANTRDYIVVNNRNGTYDIFRRNYTTEDTERLVSSQTYVFDAKLQYQYLAAAPHLYEFDSMTVRNQAFPGDDINNDRKIVYDASEMNMPNVTVLMQLYNETAAERKLPYLTIMDGSRGVNDINYTPLGNDYHYKFASTTEYPHHAYTVYITNENELNGRMYADKMAEAAKIANNCWSRNDYISINDGKTNFVLMKADKVTGATVIDKSTGQTLVSGTTAATSDYRYGAIYTMAKINASLLAERVTGSKTVTIPTETDNADYPTSCECTWVSLFGDEEEREADKLTLYAGKNIYAGAGVDDIYEHVMNGGRGPKHVNGDMYPVRVHTPVVSPIRIVNPDKTIAKEQTQLIEGYSYNPYADNQLLLDSSYFILWDNQTWLSQLYGEVEGYNDILDKYTKDKWVRFPFAVVYENTLYEVDAETGYTDWIKVIAPDVYNLPYDAGVDVNNYESANHWQMTPFYIPSFAEEGGELENEIHVECKVEAVNVLGRDLGNHTSAVQLTGNLNSSRESYVALSRVDVQLSGWIYDFSIVGTNHKFAYTGNLDDIGITNYSFAEMKEEKKTGTLNRFGTPYLRYLTDGEVTDSWNPNNTIPLRAGQSNYFTNPENSGLMWRGQNFAYTIKTISGLNGPNDSLEIIPSFTWVKANGDVLNSKNGDFKIYVGDEFTEFNPNDWSLEEGNRIALDNPKLKESYYDTADSNSYQFGDWLTNSVENANLYATGWTINKKGYLYRDVVSYDFNHISIPAELRYISGEYEQLRMNMDRQYTRGASSNLLTYETINGYGDAQEIDFIRSMQQWQSAYVVPNNLKIVDTRERGGASFNLTEYRIEKGAISNDDEIFEDLRDGYLVINFDIIAYKDGKPYLRYTGGYDGATNMWDREGFMESPNTDPTDDIPDGTVPDGYDPTIPVKDGDVAIVDLNRRMQIYIEPAIQNIN